VSFDFHFLSVLLELCIHVCIVFIVLFYVYFSVSKGKCTWFGDLSGPMIL